MDRQALVTLLKERCRQPPFDHQIEGIAQIISKPYFGLFDEMGAGKTFQAICAAQILFLEGQIDKVIVVCPAAVRSVWYDEELGELVKHLWSSVPSLVSEFHSKTRAWMWEKAAPTTRRLFWTITNYDFIRASARLLQLYKDTGQRTLLILDESSAVKNYRAQQTKACLALRNKCGRVLLLNGTPIAHSPLDMFSQGNIMHPSILQCPSIVQYRSRYAIMGGFEMREIVKWRPEGIADIQRRFAPYVIRRLKQDCIDLPEKLPPQIFPVPLTEPTWKHYKQMRDEMVAWLSETQVSVVAQAAAKMIRLSQITSGFLGGVVEETAVSEDVIANEDRPSWLPFQHASMEELPTATLAPPEYFGEQKVLEISREKLDVFLNRLQEHWLAEDPHFKAVVWCEFRAEVERLANAIPPGVEVAQLMGGQTQSVRAQALRLLDPRTAPEGPAILVGTPATGSMGITLVAAHNVIYMSHGSNLKTRKQSEDRNHRPGQRNVVSYYDFVATGPAGQKTIDHIKIKALHEKDDIATWTTAAWIQALKGL